MFKKNIIKFILKVFLNGHKNVKWVWNAELLKYYKLLQNITSNVVVFLDKGICTKVHFTSNINFVWNLQCDVYFEQPAGVFYTVCSVMGKDDFDQQTECKSPIAGQSSSHQLFKIKM